MGPLSRRVGHKPKGRLRPPPQQQQPQAGNATHDDDGDDGGHLDDDDPQLASEPLPLDHAVVCLTGIHDPLKTAVVAAARALGATVLRDLTLDVTLLVCTSPCPPTPKYDCAVKNRIAVVRPSFLLDLHALFVAGEPVSPALALESHALPPFQDIVVALHSLPDAPPRQALLHTLRQRGATVELHVSEHTTHVLLLAPLPPGQVLSNPSELDAIERLKHATRADVSLVWAEWAQDSAAANGALPTEPFLVSADTPRPGSLLTTLLTSTRAEVEVSSGQANTEESHNATEKAVVKKRTTSDSHSNRASKVAQSFCLDQELGVSKATKRRFDEVDDDLPDISNMQSARAKLIQPQETTRSAPSLVRTLSTIQSEAFGVSRASCPPDTVTLFSGANSEQTQSDEKRGKPPQFLKAVTVSIGKGFKRDPAASCRNAVREFGGTVVDDPSASDYHVVPIINPTWLPTGCNPVSASWLEHCFHCQTFVHPDDFWGGRPLLIPMPLPNADTYVDHVFTSAGFSQPETKLLEGLLKKAGLKYLVTGKRSQVTHIIAGQDKDSTRLKQSLAWTEKPRYDIEQIVIDVLAATRITFVTNAQTQQTSMHSEKEDLSKTGDGILSSCVVLFSRRIIGQDRKNGTKICNMLGATVVTEWSDEVTHLIHSATKVNEPMKEVKLARDAKAFIIHPNWLSKCQQVGSRVDEHTFPATYNPESALQYAIVPDRSSRSASIMTGLGSGSRSTSAARMRATSYLSADEDGRDQTKVVQVTLTAEEGKLPCAPTAKTSLFRPESPSSQLLHDVDRAPMFDVPDQIQDDRPPLISSPQHEGNPVSSPVKVNQLESREAGPSTQIHELLTLLAQPASPAIVKDEGNSTESKRQGGRRPIRHATSHGSSVGPTASSVQRGVGLRGLAHSVSGSPTIHQPVASISVEGRQIESVVNDRDEAFEASMKLTWVSTAEQLEEEKISKAIKRNQRPVDDEDSNAAVVPVPRKRNRRPSVQDEPRQVIVKKRTSRNKP